MMNMMMKKRTNPIKTVGVAGCMNRIGTTTQAIQIVKYLRLMGYKACYIEMNSHTYLEGMPYRYFGVKQVKGRISLEDVDMYPHSQLPNIHKQDYDLFIKDYGSYDDNDFQEVSFLEQDIKIFVAGAKINEVSKTEDVLKKIDFEPNGYIFSFIANYERDAVKEKMDQMDNVFFADYVPDPFNYVSTANRMYRSMLEV